MRCNLVLRAWKFILPCVVDDSATVASTEPKQKGRTREVTDPTEEVELAARPSVLPDSDLEAMLQGVHEQVKNFAWAHLKHQARVKCDFLADIIGWLKCVRDEAFDFEGELEVIFQRATTSSADENTLSTATEENEEASTTVGLASKELKENLIRLFRSVNAKDNDGDDSDDRLEDELVARLNRDINIFCLVAYTLAI